MLCIIANYNLDEKARELKQKFSKYFETIIVDSSEKEKEGFVSVCNGLNFKKSCELFIESKHKRCLFICSDVEIENESVERIFRRICLLKDSIGLYTPVVEGKSHWFLKHEIKATLPNMGFRDGQNNNLFEIPFCEGMILCSNKEIIQKLLNENVIEKTFLGWGLDMYKGYLCKELGFKCVKDNSIKVFHPYSRSYNSIEGKKAMTKFANLIGFNFKKFLNENGFELPFYKRWFYKLKNGVYFA